MAETRIALVTGGNRGIGLEIVRQLARAGLIAVLGARDVAKGQAAAETLKSEGMEAPVVALDVAVAGSAQAAVAEVMRLFQRIDVLVNNAAILLDSVSEPMTSAFEVEEDLVRRTLDTNLIGAWRMMQAVIPPMRDKGYGRIVNVSSRAGQLDDMRSGYPAYRVSKTALNALTRTAAAEVHDLNIKINAMCPGWVKTDMGGSEATRSVEQGAETAVWLATLPDDGPTGGFFKDKKPLAW